MKTAVYSTKPYDKRFLTETNRGFDHELTFLEAALNPHTVALAEGHGAICAFVNDELSEEVLQNLTDRGIHLVALRCAGFNHVDLKSAAELGITVARVPAYSPYAVAEHTVGMILSLNRKIHRAYSRVREGNFALDGLLGFDLQGKTVGIVGTGEIGTVTARILSGFGCNLVGYDLYPNEECRALGVRYCEFGELLDVADIISLHCPLTPDTHHIMDSEAFARMKHGAMLVNTSRGAIIDTKAAIEALKSGRLGSLGLDVYEEEGDLFFTDLSDKVLQDDVFARLLTFPNVLITGHQAFFTEEALIRIAETTLENLRGFEEGAVPDKNIVKLKEHVR